MTRKATKSKKKEEKLESPLWEDVQDKQIMHENANKPGIRKPYTRKDDSPRGFAKLSEEERTELSRRGAEALHEAGMAHQFKPGKKAKEAQKGSVAARRRKRVIAWWHRKRDEKAEDWQ